MCQNNKRRRKVLWYIPPFNLYCSTNVGKQFRQIIERHFSKNDMLGRLFNKNKMKLSYSCLGNIRSKISAHNRRLLSDANHDTEICNCQDKERCPIPGGCNIYNVVY